MSGKSFNNLLFTFKKDSKGACEILYFSNCFSELIEHPISTIDVNVLKEIFPVTKESLFDRFFNLIQSQSAEQILLLLKKKQFIWLKLEGHIFPLPDNGFVVNILFKPAMTRNLKASWIYLPKEEKLFSQYHNPPNFSYSMLAILVEEGRHTAENGGSSNVSKRLPLPLGETELGHNVGILKSKITEEGHHLLEVYQQPSDHRQQNWFGRDQDVLQPTISDAYIQHILFEVSKISAQFRGNSVFDEILKKLYREMGFSFGAISCLNKNPRRCDIISFCENGNISQESLTDWQHIISRELCPSEKNEKLLIIAENFFQKYPDYSILKAKGINSVIALDIFDKEEGKIGVLVFFDTKPMKYHDFYRKLFNLLGDWLSKELYRFKYESALEEINFMHDAILNGTAYAIFAVNKDLDIILINENTLPVFNIKSKDKLMDTILSHENQNYKLAEIIAYFSKSNKETDYFILDKGNGDFKELKMSFTKIKLSGNNQVSFVIFVDDITDRTLSEKRLISSEQLYRSIAENFPKGTIDVLDKSFNYIYSDGEEYRSTGIDPKILIGTHHLDKYSGENYEITKNNLNEILKGKTVSYEISQGNKKFLKNGVPLTNNSGEIDRILLVKQNITEEKKLEGEREKLIKDLKSHNEELLRFAYIVSHNLRAPIVNISLLLDLYNESQPDDPENKEVIENLKISTNLLDTTLQDLIEVVSIKKQKIPKVELIDFKLLFNNVEKSLYNQLKESGLRIHKDFSRLEEMNYVYAHMENFIMNFMTNSVKYKHPDRVPEVWISAYKENNYCVICFEDNGIGMDLERYGDRLFGLYQRFHNHVEGKGLGLYLVREQIRANDGKIEVNSTVGKGTVFRIYLRNLILPQNQNMK